MRKLKIALIWGHHYNDKPFHTHHTFFELTLRDMDIQFERFSWHDWQLFMESKYDLYLFIDFDPSLYKVHDKNWLHPRAFLWWDSFHFSFAYPAQVTELFDRSYFVELNTVTALQNQGLTTVCWSPPAFYEQLYRPLDIQKDLDFSFIGQPDDTVVNHGLTRKQFVQKLSSHSLNNIKLNGVVAQGVYGDAVNELYNRSKILFDRTIYNNVGTRAGEIIGSGGFALINKGKVNSGIDRLAVDGHHFVSYDGSFDDFMRKFEYYLDHPQDREKIAIAGRDHYFKYHTYKHRIISILTDFGLI